MIKIFCDCCGAPVPTRAFVESKMIAKAVDEAKQLSVEGDMPFATISTVARFGLSKDDAHLCTRCFIEGIKACLTAAEIRLSMETKQYDRGA